MWAAIAVELFLLGSFVISTVIFVLLEITICAGVVLKKAFIVLKTSIFWKNGNFTMALRNVPEGIIREKQFRESSRRLSSNSSWFSIFAEEQHLE